MNEVELAEQLLAFDTATAAGLERAMDFVAGWMHARDVRIREERLGDRRCLIATAGAGATRVLFNGHMDVVPGHPDQFTPRRRGGRLYGRGAYDMKGALAAMMLATAEFSRQPSDGAVLDFLIVPDEERSEPGINCSEGLVRDGLTADFVICGEPTDLHVGIQAKGVVLICAHVSGVAAHGSTPWLGENAVLRAIDLYGRMTQLPFMAESSDMFPSPSINLSRIDGGDALNSVPDTCAIWVDIRSLPGQDRRAIVEDVRALDPSVRIDVVVDKPAANVASTHPFVEALVEAARRADPQARVVGRDGSSDAIPFVEKGIPAVEFGPVGAGHHGPDEYVEMASLGPYRQSLVAFVRAVAATSMSPEYVI